MSITTLTNCAAYLDKYSLGTRLNQMNIEYAAEEVDATTFGSGARVTVPGFTSVAYDFQGYWDSADDAQIDPALSTIHGANCTLTVSPTAAAVGDVAYITRVTQSTLTRGGAVGEMFAIGSQGKSIGQPLVRGRILANGAKTTTGSGAAVYQLDSDGLTKTDVDSGQYLYGTLHVTAISGTDTPTITVKIQSDDNDSFTSALDRITFSAATTTIAQWATPVAGPLTDTYFRATWTVSGTNPSLTIVCAMGIK